MNVLILTKTFPESDDDWGGNFVKEQADVLSLHNNLIVVKIKVDYRDFAPFLSYKTVTEDKENYKIIKIIVAKSFPVFNQLNFIIASYKALKNIACQNHFDVIHCHYSYPAGVVAILLKHKFNIPVVITEHSRLKKTFRSIFHKRLSLFALKNADKVVAVSKSLKREMVELNIKNIVILPNVINTDRFQNVEKDNNIYTIGFLGNLNTNNKGLDLLLEACSDLTFDFRLKIGGSGTLLEEFKKMSKEKGVNGKAEFMGNINPYEIDRFYSSIDLFVLPSRYETFGMVLIEALASGIPVIATKCGGPDDIISKECGLLVDVENSNQLREAIEFIYLNQNNYPPEKLKAFVKDKFGTVAFIQKAEALYISCRTTSGT